MNMILNIDLSWKIFYPSSMEYNFMEWSFWPFA